jgi:ATP-dependent RNA helicase DeaD
MDHEQPAGSNPGPSSSGGEGHSNHSNDHGGDAPGSPGAPGEGGGRRRRRRRGGRGRNKNNGNGGPPNGEAVGTGAPEGDAGSHDQSDSAGPANGSAGQPSNNGGGGAPDLGDPDRRRRRRGGRGRGRGDGSRDGQHAGSGGHGGHGGQRHDGPRSNDHSHDEDGPPIAPRPKRERAEREPSGKEWDEIFNQQTFADLGLRNSVVKGCEEAGFKHPTKIQAQLIPLVIAGKDVLGQSRTGSGKTAAFGLPLFHGAVRGLAFQSFILAPTRELALQIAAELTELGKFTPIKVSAVYGGQEVRKQAAQLDANPEIIVATPGRLMDMRERGYLHFNNAKYVVLDEVDRMLDIGFRDDIKKILSSIKSEHQTVFVSATISDEIEKLARTFMKEPEKIITAGGSLTVSLVDQYYISVEPWDKRRMLLHLLTHEDPELTVVFCRTKRTVDDLCEYLRDKGVDAHSIHGDMYQGKRNTVMKRLRDGTLGVLVASDLAARGLDVDGISHVVNYDLPEDPEVYIHRIGRTARAGRGGVALGLLAP